MHEYFPNWKNNKYLKQKGFIYKLYSKLIYNKKYNLIIFINNIKRKEKIPYIRKG